MKWHKIMPESTGTVILVQCTSNPKPQHTAMPPEALVLIKKQALATTVTLCASKPNPFLPPLKVHSCLTQLGSTSSATWPVASKTTSDNATCSQ